MKTTEFNNFINFLETDTKTTECMGYAFLNMTEKQLCKVIKWYHDKGMCDIVDKNETQYLQFGTQRQFYVSYDKYKGAI